MKKQDKNTSCTLYDVVKPTRTIREIKTMVSDYKNDGYPEPELNAKRRLLFDSEWLLTYANQKGWPLL